MKMRGKKFWGIFALVAPIASILAMLVIQLLFRTIAILSDIELLSQIDRVLAIVIQIFFTWAIIAFLVGIPVGIVLLVLAKSEKDKVQN